MYFISYCNSSGGLLIVWKQHLEYIFSGRRTDMQNIIVCARLKTMPYVGSGWCLCFVYFWRPQNQWRRLAVRYFVREATDTHLCVIPESLISDNLLMIKSPTPGTIFYYHRVSRATDRYVCSLTASAEPLLLVHYYRFLRAIGIWHYYRVPEATDTYLHIIPRPE